MRFLWKASSIYLLVLTLVSCMGSSAFASAQSYLQDAWEDETPDFDGKLKRPFNGRFSDLKGRVIVIYNERSEESLAYLGQAQDAVAVLQNHDERWSRSFVFLAKRRDRAMVNKISQYYLKENFDFVRPLFVYVDGKEVVRRFETECSTPLDHWSFAWLYKGYDERPDETVPPEEIDRYPMTGSWWSVEGDWNPTRAKILKHLEDARLHTGYFERWWLELLSYKELQSVHTDHHRELTGTGKVKWEYVNVEEPPRAASSANRICVRNYYHPDQDICDQSVKHAFVEPADGEQAVKICAAKYSDALCRGYGQEFNFTLGTDGKPVCVMNYNQPEVGSNYCESNPDLYAYVREAA